MENVDFELYHIFYCVAKKKNMTKAANELYISQPAITQSIHKLEQQIGYNLFYRTRSGMELTKEGEILYNYLKLPIQCLETGKEKIKKEMEEQTTFRIGSGTTLLKHNVVPILKQFQKQYPKVKIEIYHDVSNVLLEMLENGLLDIVILKQPKTISDKWITIPICKTDNGFVASTEEFSHLQNHICSLEELNPLILQSHASSSRQDLDYLFQNTGFLPNPSYELASYGLVLDFIKAGLGIGFINKEHVKKELKQHKLFEITTNIPISSRPIMAAIPKKLQYHPLIIEFIKQLKSRS